MFKVVETIVVAQALLQEALNNVAEFWSNHPCMGEWADDLTQFEALRSYRYQSHPWLHAEVAEFDQHTTERVLEIGCSQGIDMVEFLKFGVREYIGVDLSFRALLLARRRLQYFNLTHLPVTLICCSAEDLPLRDGLFDYVYSYGAIHHSANTLRAVDSIHRVLRSKGRFTVMYYYKYSLTAFIEGCAKLVNRLLVALSHDRNAFHKLCLKLPYRPAIGHYRAFLNTGYSAILHAPFAHTFGKRQSRRMFSAFRLESLKLYQLSPVVRPIIAQLFGQRAVSRLASWTGWDLVIKGMKE